MKKHGFYFKPKNKVEGLIHNFRKSIRLRYYSFKRAFLDPLEYWVNYFWNLKGISLSPKSYEDNPEKLWQEVLNNKYEVSGKFILPRTFTRVGVKIRKDIIKSFWERNPDYSVDEISSFWDNLSVEELSTKDPNLKRFLLLLNLLRRVPSRLDPLQTDMDELFPLIGLRGGTLVGYKHNFKNYPENIYVPLTIEKEVIKKLNFRGSKLHLEHFILNYIVHDMEPLIKTLLKTHAENRRFNKFLSL